MTIMGRTLPTGNLPQTGLGPMSKKAGIPFELLFCMKFILLYIDII
jgi:hypothetical protein